MEFSHTHDLNTLIHKTSKFKLNINYYKYHSLIRLLKNTNLNFIKANKMQYFQNHLQFEINYNDII